MIQRNGSATRRDSSRRSYGITKEEARAAKYDPACVFCRCEDEEAESPEHDHDDESCPLCDDLARAWRATHADALRSRGLG